MKVTRSALPSPFGVRGQAVDADLILLAAVVEEAVLALLQSPLDEHLPLLLQLVDGHGEAAGGLRRLDFEEDDLPLAGQLGEVRTQGRPLPVPGAHDAAAPVDAEDERALGEATEHDRHPPVLREVRGRLVAAPRQVEVGDPPPPVEAAERVHALRREVDATLGGRRRREEHLLLADEGLELFVEPLVELGHRLSPSQSRMVTSSVKVVLVASSSGQTLISYAPVFGRVPLQSVGFWPTSTGSMPGAQTPKTAFFFAEVRCSVNVCPSFARRR